MTIKNIQSCPLCTTQGGVLLFRAAHWRIIRATDQQDFPLTYRVVWNAHVAEFSELANEEQIECMSVVAWVEQAMRTYLKPEKINLAALGNVVPHLHWHLIARFGWDSRFPAPIWAPAVRENCLSEWQSLIGQQNELDIFIQNNASVLA